MGSYLWVAVRRSSHSQLSFHASISYSSQPSQFFFSQKHFHAPNLYSFQLSHFKSSQFPNFHTFFFTVPNLHNSFLRSKNISNRPTDFIFVIFASKLRCI